MATYYLSFSEGDDANLGTSEGEAWKTLGRVDSSSIGPGDTLLLKAGDVWDGILRLPNHGTLGNRILVSRYGTGDDPIIYGNYLNSAATEWNEYVPPAVAAAGDLTPHVSAGMSVAKNSGESPAPNVLTPYVSAGVNPAETAVVGTGVFIFVRQFSTNIDRCTNLTTDYDYFPTDGYDLDDPQDLDRYLTDMPKGNFGGKIFDPTTYVKLADGDVETDLRLWETTGIWTRSHTTIERIDWRQSNYGCEGGETTGFVLQDCKITNTLSFPIWLRINHTDAVIQRNVITDCGAEGIVARLSTDTYIAYNTIDKISSEVLGLDTSPSDKSGIGFANCTRTIAEHNTILNTAEGGFFDVFFAIDTRCRYNYGFNCGTYAINTAGKGMIVHHNIFDCNLNGEGISAGWLSETGPGEDNLIANNVVVNSKTVAIYAQNAQATVRNNIVVTDSGQFTNATDVSDLDHNCFWSPGGGVTWRFNNVTYNTFAEYQTASNAEDNSINEDPLFVGDGTGGDVDYDLQQGSPCIDTGENLTDSGLMPSGYSYTDYAGNPIQSGDLVEIGAYSADIILPQEGFSSEQLSSRLGLVFALTCHRAGSINADLAIGFDDQARNLSAPSPGALAMNGSQFDFRAGAAVVPNIASCDPDTEYEARVIARTQGAHTLIKGGEYALDTLLWIDESQITPANVYANVTCTVYQSYCDDMQIAGYWTPIPITSDSFDRINSADLGSTDRAAVEEGGELIVAWEKRAGANIEIISNQIEDTGSAIENYAYVDTADADVIVKAKVSPKANGVVGICARDVSDDSWALILDQQAGEMRILQGVTVQQSLVIPIVADQVYDLTLICDGQQIIGFVDGTYRLEHTSSVNQTATKHGIVCGSGRVDDFSVWPRHPEIVEGF